MAFQAWGLGRAKDKILNGAGRPTTGNCQKRRVTSVSLTAKHKSIFSVLLLRTGDSNSVHSSHLARMTWIKSSVIKKEVSIQITSLKGASAGIIVPIQYLKKLKLRRGSAVWLGNSGQGWRPGLVSSANGQQNESQTLVNQNYVQFFLTKNKSHNLWSYPRLTETASLSGSLDIWYLKLLQII